jgi:hypothetical protein
MIKKVKALIYVTVCLVWFVGWALYYYGSKKGRA